MKINIVVYEALKNAGWFEGRLLPSKPVIDTLNAGGFPVFPAVLSFLTSFGDLHIYFDNLLNGLRDDIHLDIERATHLESGESIEEKKYAARIGKKVSLIGSAYREHFVLLMAKDGYVYGAYEHYLCFIAKSGLMAIEAIILNYELVEIP